MFRLFGLWGFGWLFGLYSSGGEAAVEEDVELVQGGLSAVAPALAAAAGVFGQLPAVLPAHRTEQPAHLVPHPPPRLHAPEPLTHPQQQQLPGSTSTSITEPT